MWGGRESERVGLSQVPGAPSWGVVWDELVMLEEVRRQCFQVCSALKEMVLHLLKRLSLDPALSDNYHVGKVVE